MAILNPYLYCSGNAAEVFNFYKSVFGGEYANLMQFKEMPGGEKLPPSQASKVLHVALPIGKGTMLMGSDHQDDMPPTATISNFCLSIGAETLEEAHRLFNGLSAGGEITMPLHESFWGDTFGMFTDKFGFKWMLSFNEKYHQQ